MSIAAYYYNEGKASLAKSRSMSTSSWARESLGFAGLRLANPPRGTTPRSKGHIIFIRWRSTTRCTRCARPSSRVYNNDELYVVAQTAELVGDRIATARWIHRSQSPYHRAARQCPLGKLREQLEASPTKFGKGCRRRAARDLASRGRSASSEMIEDDVLAMERRSLHDFRPEEVARESSN